MTASAWPNIDPRIHAVGVAKLREMNATMLRKLSDELYVLQDGEEPLAVLIGYKDYLAIQNKAKEIADDRQ